MLARFPRISLLSHIQEASVKGVVRISPSCLWIHSSTLRRHPAQLLETRVHHERGLRSADHAHILRFNYSPVEGTLPALWKVFAGRMKSRLGSSLFVQPPPGFALRAITRAFSLPAGVALTLLSEVERLYSQVIPRCIHSENCYSFPMTFAGKTTRTCHKCGHRREYDMNTMRFVTGRFDSTP